MTEEEEARLADVIKREFGSVSRRLEGLKNSFEELFAETNRCLAAVDAALDRMDVAVDECRMTWERTGRS